MREFFSVCDCAPQAHKGFPFPKESCRKATEGICFIIAFLLIGYPTIKPVRTIIISIPLSLSRKKTAEKNIFSAGFCIFTFS